MSAIQIISLITALAIVAVILIHGQVTGIIHPFGQKLRKPKEFTRAYMLTPAKEQELIDYAMSRLKSLCPTLQNIMTTHHPDCRRCKTQMKDGKALVSTLTGVPDFAGDTHASTVSPGGPGRLVSVSKCPDCGHSVSR